MIPIAAGIIAAFLIAIVHIVVHLFFLLVLLFQKEASVIKLPWGSGNKKGVGSIVVIGLATLITILWLYDFIALLTIKYFEINAIFTIIAIAVTCVYAMWIIYLIKDKKTNAQHPAI
ncbi:hypothetical protein Q0590_36640 [Rhodocytophaga aerolata]|uniref:Uncharacterized protein n=1 Tax=Rhodocytophaga aerolata TaxID=455078 RepID=A0ABT8RKW0_9BACT|nr:hypothetical protein [Rhodocytophaga aerolata]MDO1451855.1 hypothetical protein [Rhodocytophaga aerolata]